MMTHSDTLHREQVFHDRWAQTIDPATVLVDESFQLPVAAENRFIISRLGELKGKRLLELGCGAGEASVYFAKRGADVVATDLSPSMLQLAARIADYHHVRLATEVCSAQRLPFADESFDVVYAANLLHHVDAYTCLSEIKRVLKPGGRAAFYDPLRYNPIINVYRAMASQVRSADERPLGIKHLQIMRGMFSQVDCDFFWFFSLAVFLKFFFVNQVHPNEERYWKKILRDFHSIDTLYTALQRIDGVLLRLPGFRWLAWNIAVVVRK